MNTILCSKKPQYVVSLIVFLMILIAHNRTISQSDLFFKGGQVNWSINELQAYCGTGSNDAIRKLLHVAVSDVNDDVRRAAVMGLGFLLFKNPEQCPGM